MAWAFGCDTTLAADYALKRTLVLGGEGGWDYLTYDASRGRLFISRGTHVQVVDPEKGSLLGDIPDTPGVHGIALADELGKGFISNGRDNSITVFDLATLETLAKIRTEGGVNPDFIAYDSVSKRIFAFNGRSHNASVIDAVGLRLLAAIPLEGKPEAAVTDGRGLMFVNIEDKNQITELDTRQAVVTRSWPVPGCEQPAALAIDRESHRLFAGCLNRLLAILDAESGQVVAGLPIGEGVDAAAFDPETKLTFSAQGDGTVTIVKMIGGQYAVVQNIVTRPGARTLALNPKNHDVYLVTAEFEASPPAEGQKRPQRIMKPGTFMLLVLGAEKS